MTENKWLNRLILVVVVAFLFWNPITRQIILFVLPFGSGIDDLIFIVLLVLAIVVYLIYKLEVTRRRIVQDSITVVEIVLSFVGLDGAYKKIKEEVNRRKR